MMNIGYVFDLSGLLCDKHNGIPYLHGLAIDCAAYNKGNGLTLTEIKACRDRMMMKYAKENIKKHFFYFVFDNDFEILPNLARCVNTIQGEPLFDQQHYVIHLLCNFTREDGFDIAGFQNAMPALRDNRNNVYTWLLDKYDDNGAMPIPSLRRSHALWRLIGMLNNHGISLRQMDNQGNPLYTFFGDASIFFDEEQRNTDARNYYFFKNLQHLLNLSDLKIEEFMQGYVRPFYNNAKEMEKRLDAQAEGFLEEQRVPIQAPIICDVTQNLLIKDAEDDQEYLVDVKDDSLVFIEDLSRKQDWKMKETDALLQEFYIAVEKGERVQEYSGEEYQEKLSSDFLERLQEKVDVQKRILENDITKEISHSRESQVEMFKNHLDNHLLKFLNKQDDLNYNFLNEKLLEDEVKKHCSNLDYGISFLEYLAEGRSNYLVDQEVAVGDVNLEKIRRHAYDLKEKRAYDLDKKEKEMTEKKRPGANGEPSRIRTAFNMIDQRIDSFIGKIRRLNYQIEKWWDADEEKKLTTKSKIVLAVLTGVFLALIWWLVSATFIAPLFDDPKDWLKQQWTIFVLLVLAGVVVGSLFFWQWHNNLKNAKSDLKRAKQEKKNLMSDCVKDEIALVELRYNYKLAYYALKTIDELIELAQLKKKDLENYRKELFKLMLKYKIALENQGQNQKNDFNTIELKDHDVARILFGEEDNGREIRYRFAQDGVELAATFAHYRNRKALLETTRFNFDYVPAKDFDREAVAKEVIPACSKHANEGLEYSALPQLSVLPPVEGVEMDDVHQGSCGDCYFLATLASIANVNPDFIIGERGLVEELDEEEHKFFRVRFYDKDGNRVNIDINNKFWNKNGIPFYAGKGKSTASEGNTYDPWVMAVEKAWAKANNAGYDGIEAASADGVERHRKVEYSFAVTGKSAFYCMTKNVLDPDRLAEMIRKHFANEKPVTFYSASPSDSDFSNKDQFLVTNHAYALRSANEDGTFDIFNPWNSHPEGERGQHYKKKDIIFIKDNFDVVVFFDIKESDFDSFERDLTGNVQQKELTDGIERLLAEGFDEIGLPLRNIGDLLNDEDLRRMCTYSSYLYNTNTLRDRRGIDGGEHHRLFIEGTRDYAKANEKVGDFVKSNGDGDVEELSNRVDDKQSITLLKVSSHYRLDNFCEVLGQDGQDKDGHDQDDDRH